MEVRRPRHRAKIGEALYVRAVELHRVNVRVHALLVEAPPEDALAVRREERTAIVAGRAREAARFRAVGVHQINLAEPRGIGFEYFSVFRWSVRLWFCQS